MRRNWFGGSLKPVSQLVKILVYETATLVVFSIIGCFPFCVAELIVDGGQNASTPCSRPE